MGSRSAFEMVSTQREGGILQFIEQSLKNEDFLDKIYEFLAQQNMIGERRAPAPFGCLTVLSVRGTFETLCNNRMSGISKMPWLGGKCVYFPDNTGKS